MRIARMPGLSRRQILLVALLVAGGALPLLLFARRFLESDILALAVSVQDDSFYYLLPAWNFSSRGYFTFDGMHRTYGFQPLYMLLLTGLSALAPTIEAAFRIGLCANAILHTATGVLVGIAVSTALPRDTAYVREIVSLLAAAGYWLAYNLFWANVTLKENPLSSFLYVLSIVCVLRAVSCGGAGGTRAHIMLGATLGCLILCRLLPSTLLAVGVSLVVTGRSLPRRSMVMVIGSALVPVLLWGGYAKVAFGRVVPSSFSVKAPGETGGVMRYWLAKSPAEVAALLSGYLQWAVGFLGDAGKGLGHLRVGVLAAGGIALVLCLVIPAWWSRPRTALVALLMASLAGLICIPLGLPQRQHEWTYVTWYLFDITAIASIVTAVALGFIGQRVEWRVQGAWGDAPRRTLGVLGMGLICLGTLAAEDRVFRAVRPLPHWGYSASEWQHVMARSGLWFKAAVRLGEDERVGAWNAGLLGFLMPRQVINLDGLANDDVVEYRRRGGSLGEYIRRHNIRYIIDVVPPASLEAMGLVVDLLKTEDTANPRFPRYYILRLQWNGRGRAGVLPDATRGAAPRSG